MGNSRIELIAGVMLGDYSEFTFWLSFDLHYYFNFTFATKVYTFYGRFLT